MGSKTPISRQQRRVRGVSSLDMATYLRSMVRPYPLSGIAEVDF